MTYRLFISLGLVLSLSACGGSSGSGGSSANKEDEIIDPGPRNKAATTYNKMTVSEQSDLRGTVRHYSDAKSVLEIEGETVKASYDPKSGALRVLGQDGNVIFEDLDGPDSNGNFRSTDGYQEAEFITANAGFKGNYDYVQMVHTGSSPENNIYWESNGFIGVPTDPQDVGKVRYTLTGEAINPNDTNIRADARLTVNPDAGNVALQLNNFKGNTTFSSVQVDNVPLNGAHFEGPGSFSFTGSNAPNGDYTSYGQRMSGDLYGYSHNEQTNVEGADEAAGYLTFGGMDGNFDYNFMVD